MAHLDQLAPLLDSCYNAVTDSTLWHTFTEQLQATFGADRIYLTAPAADPRASIFTLAGCSQEDIADYSTYWHRHDVILHTITAQLQKHGHWSGTLDSILPFEDLSRSMIYNESPNSRGLRHMLGLAAANVGSFHMVGLGIWRRDARSAFSDEQTQLFHLLSPHFLQAMRLHASILSLRAEADLLRAGVETSGAAFIALGSTGSILLASPAAAALLHPAPPLAAIHHGLCDTAGRLHAVDPATDQLLQHALHLAASTAALDRAATSTRTPPALRSLPIPRSGTLRPLILQITPYRGAFQAICPAAMVFLTDPDSTPPTRAQLLRELFQLSPVESRLADLLLQGHELRDAGSRLRLSYDSARFHLKQVFGKTGTRRQSELLRLLAALPSLSC